MEFGLADTFGATRAHLVRPASYAQATEALAAMEEVRAYTSPVSHLLYISPVSHLYLAAMEEVLA